MSLPTDITRANFFYPLGNTPAVCLTRHLTPELDARILLLGSGDLRNVLFTCYADGAPDRALDITLCDYEPGVVARNILLLSLVSDGVSDAALWDIYYHFRITPESLNIIHSHAKNLSSLAASPESWRSGILSAFVDIPAPSTRATLQRLWARWAEESSSPQGRPQKNLDAIVRKATKGGRLGFSGMGLSCMIPCFTSSGSTCLTSDHNTYWAQGAAATSLDTNPKPQCVNPTFVAGDGSTFAHYATDPVSGFHLSTWCPDITAESPLTGGKTLADTAKQEFTAWLGALKEKFRNAGIVFRFVIADALSFCSLLQARMQPRDRRLACFVDHWHFEHLTLPTNSSIPETFNVIDTSNLIDHLGGLNILSATSPLLERSTAAALYTELLIVRSDGVSMINESLHGDVGTISSLLGLFPAEHYTNATVSSSAELAMMMKSISSAQDPHKQTQTMLRMTWRRAPGYDTESLVSRLHMSPDDMAGLLYSVYQNVFSYEDAMKQLRLGGTPNPMPRTFTRESWAASIVAFKANVETDWEAAMKRFYDLAVTDRTSLMSWHHLQDLGLYLHLYGLHSTMMLAKPPSALSPSSTGLDINPAAALPGLPSMPSVVCLTMRVPRSKLSPITRRGIKESGTPSIIGIVEANFSSPTDPNAWQNFHYLIQAGFGEIKASKSGVTTDSVKVARDTAGWSGTSSLVISFLVPTWVLLRDPRTVRVKLALAPAPQTAMIFAAELGLDLSLHHTTLVDDKDLYIAPDWPNWADVPVAAVSKRTPPAPATTELRYTTTAKPTASRDKIGSIISRVDFGPGAYRAALQAKAAVSVKALAPNLVQVSIGVKPPIRLLFPALVDTANLKTRIARTSSYIEVEAPAATAPNWTNHPEYMFPVSPPTALLKGQPMPLNITRCHLPALPELQLPAPDPSKFSWFKTHTAAVFSGQESVLKRNQDQAGSSPKSPRYDIKDSFFSLFTHYSATQGPQMRIFGFGDPNNDGVQIIIFVSAMRLDIGAQSVVLDAAILPLRTEAMPLMGPSLSKLSKPGFLCQIIVKDDEMKLWKAALPAMTERCRTWKHKPSCEYAKKGRVPVSEGFGERLLCGCGEGVFPEGYDGGHFPGWNTARKFATRAAIPMPFPVATVERLIRAP